MSEFLDMARFQCSLPGCTFMTPPAIHDPLCKTALLLAHINVHLVSLLLPPVPPQPSVFPGNLLPSPFPSHSFLGHPISPAAHLPVVTPDPTTGAAMSSRRSSWVLPPLFNQRIAERRRLMSPQMELDSATNFRSGVPPSSLTTSTMVTAVGTAPVPTIPHVDFGSPK